MLSVTSITTVIAAPSPLWLHWSTLNSNPISDCQSWLWIQVNFSRVPKYNPTKQQFSLVFPATGNNMSRRMWQAPHIFLVEWINELGTVLQPFKAWQVHGIQTDGKIFTEPLGCLACLYSWVGDPRTLQVVCLPACLCMTHIMALAPQYSPSREPLTSL